MLDKGNSSIKMQRPEIQEIYREKTFGSYPHVEEIKRLRSREAGHSRDDIKPWNKSNLGFITPRGRESSAGGIARLPSIYRHGETPGFQSARENTFHFTTNHRSGSISDLEASSKRNHKKQPPKLPLTRQDSFENVNTHFRTSAHIRNKYHFICPEWISEGITLRKLYREHKSNPFKYGWA